MLEVGDDVKLHRNEAVRVRVVLRHQSNPNPQPPNWQQWFGNDGGNQAPPWQPPAKGKGKGGGKSGGKNSGGNNNNPNKGPGGKGGGQGGGGRQDGSGSSGQTWVSRDTAGVDYSWQFNRGSCNNPNCQKSHRCCAAVGR